MLTLICGTAVPAARRARLHNLHDNDMLFVVPDELTATSLAKVLSGDDTLLVTEDRIVTYDGLVQRITGSDIDTASTVPPEIIRVLVRKLIDSDPGVFDYLVGKNSVPHMSQGVLQRIIPAIVALNKRRVAEAELTQSVPLSPREKQLLLLSEMLDQRLAAMNYRHQEPVLLESLSNLPTGRWTTHFSKVKRAAFLDFLSFSDVTYRLVHAVSRHVEQCEVYLDFNPEQDVGPSAMEAAYQRLYDMADVLVTSPEELVVSEDSVHGEPAPLNAATVVVAATISAEVHAATATIRRLLDDAKASEDLPPSIVVALSDWNQYAPALEREFAAFSVRALWKENEHIVHSPDWQLLEHVRDCCGKSVTGTKLSALLRAPGFPAIVANKVGAVEAWNLASRLDYALSHAGQLSGWRSITYGVQSVLEKTGMERSHDNRTAEHGAAQDARLLELLKLLRKNLKKFEQKASIGHWCRETMVLLFNTPASGGCVQRDLRASLKTLLARFAQYERLVADESIQFTYFLTLLKTLCHGTICTNEAEFQSVAVTVCSIADAGKMLSNCCLVLGCNDGNLPQFAKPDAAFLGYSFHTSQTAYRARQRVVLEHVLRNHGRVLLFMPERIGTEELLPSQFVEELLASNKCGSIGSAELLMRLNASAEGTRQRLEEEISESLKGIVLSAGELARFAGRGRKIFNVASNMSVLASRSQAQLAGYDGILVDLRLKEWLSTWAERHIYSVSQLDSVVGCSFRFFVGRMLHLEEIEEADDLLPAHLFGSFTHDVLARFYRDWVGGGRGVPCTEDELLAREKLLAAYHVEHEKFPDASDFARDLLNLKLFGELGTEGFADPARSMDSVYDPGILGLFLQMEMARGNDPAMDFLKPANFEVGFGMGFLKEDDPLTREEYLELDLGGGETVKLRGRIDRIDVAYTGTYAVTDYKTGHIPEKREILGGFRTQLPVYTMVAEKLLLAGQVENPEPAGGLYYSLRKGQNIKVSGVFFRSVYQKQAGVPGRGLKDDEFHAVLVKVKNNVRHSLKAVRQGYLTSTRHNPEIVCRYCPFEGFCYRNAERTNAFWQGIETEVEESADAK